MDQNSGNFLFEEDLKKYNFSEMCEFKFYHKKNEQSSYFIANNFQRYSLSKMIDTQNITILIPPKCLTDALAFALDFASELVELKQLNELELLIQEKNNIRSKEIDIICQGIQSLTKLKKFNLQISNFNPIKDLGVQSIGECLKNLVTLTNLKLCLSSKLQITSDGLIQLSNGISCLNQLNFLKIKIGYCKSIKQEAWVSLGKAFGYLNNLEYFDFQVERNSNLTSEGAKAIGNGLKNICNVKFLRLVFGQNNEIDQSGCSGLAESLNGKKNLSNLSLIILQRNKIGQEGAIKIAENIATLQNLTDLNLFLGEENDIQLNGIQQLYTSISYLKKLKSLRFAVGNQNRIKSDEYSKQISQLQELKNLESLQLYFGQRSHTQMSIYNEILLMLPHFPCLKLLDLHFSEQNKFGGTKIQSLDFSQLCQSLIDLSIYVGYQNNLNDEIVNHISEGIKHLKNLQRLKLSLIFIKNLRIDVKLCMLFSSIYNLEKINYLHLDFGYLYFQNRDATKLAECLLNLKDLQKLYLIFESIEDSKKSYLTLNNSLKCCDKLKYFTFKLAYNNKYIVSFQEFIILFNNLKSLESLTINVSKSYYCMKLTGFRIEQVRELCTELTQLNHLHYLNFNQIFLVAKIKKMIIHLLKKNLKNLVQIII